MSGSGNSWAICWAICKSAPRSRQITTPAPHRSVFYSPDALPAAQPTASMHWRQITVGQCVINMCTQPWRIPVAYDTIRYDTIRDAISACARKPTWVSLIYRMELTTKKCKTEKLKSRKQICSEITVNSLGNPCSESCRRKRKGCCGKDLQKKRFLARNERVSGWWNTK